MQCTDAQDLFTDGAKGNLRYCAAFQTPNNTTSHAALPLGSKN